MNGQIAHISSSLPPRLPSLADLASASLATLVIWDNGFHQTAPSSQVRFEGRSDVGIVAEINQARD